VRFFEEVPKKAQLTVADLGSRSVISTFLDRPLTGNYQGNIADLCPVGALTLKEFRFQARVWNLRKMASTCGECSRGCSTTVEVLRGGEVKRFRPRENALVNRWWMCDVGRFAFHPFNRTDRAPAARIRGTGGLEDAPVEEALLFLEDVLLLHKDALLLASPFLTVEEGAALLAFARARGLAPHFLSPAPNGLKDDVLHTGDPCPNRRGLAELGFLPIDAAAAQAKLAGAKAALLVGDRIAELVGLEALAALPTPLRLAVFDAYALDVPALDVLVGLPTHVERAGTWVNVDGHRGPISAAKAAPKGVRSLDRILGALRPAPARSAR
jgi:NADH-quinone oxidoreductase subunit G